MMLKICMKSDNLSHKNQFYQTTNKQSSKLSEVKIWPKPNMQNSAYTKH